MKLSYHIGLISIAFLAVTASPALLAQEQSKLLAGDVTVVNKHLLRDGKPWVPHGYFQIGFAVPPGAFRTILPNGKPINPVYEIGYTNYSPTEYFDMRRAGADSVRLNVSQSAVDPENRRYFDPQFLNTVISAIHAARAAGLTVMIAAQDESQGKDIKSVLPYSATMRFWREFAPIFGHDRGVLFELYNEPGEPQDVQPTARQWQDWAAAMNEPLALVRALDAVNVIVADGLAYAQQLSGAPALKDPLNQVVYAAHPYPHSDAGQRPAAWKQKFGDFAKTEPVIITEWGPGYYCNSRTPQATLDFFQYLQDRQIGLEVVAWDWGTYRFASAIQNFPDNVSSSFLTPTGPDACSERNGNTPGVGHGPNTSFGLGKVIESWYLTGIVPSKPE